jgi:hypothetical protein
MIAEMSYEQYKDRLHAWIQKKTRAKGSQSPAG